MDFIVFSTRTEKVPEYLSTFNELSTAMSDLSWLNRAKYLLLLGSLSISFSLGMVQVRGEEEVRNVETTIEGPGSEAGDLRREILELKREVERLRKLQGGQTPDAASAEKDSAQRAAPEVTSITIRPTQKFVGHQGAVSGVVISPDGKWGASAGMDGFVRVWDLVYHSKHRVFDTPSQQLYSIAWSPDGNAIAAGGLAGVCILSASDGEIQQTLPMNGWPQSLQFSRDGKSILCAGRNGVEVWEVATAQKLQSHEDDMDFTKQALWTKDERLILCVGGYFNNSKTVATYYGRLWNPDTGEELLQLKLPVRSTYRGVRLIANDTRILMAGPAGNVQEWDIQANEEGEPWPIGRVNCLDATDDGKLVVAAGTGGTLQLWDAESRKAIDSYPIPENTIETVAISANGTRAIAGGRDGAVRSFNFYKLNEAQRPAKVSAAGGESEDQSPRKPKRRSKSKKRLESVP